MTLEEAVAVLGPERTARIRAAARAAHKPPSPAQVALIVNLIAPVLDLPHSAGSQPDALSA